MNWEAIGSIAEATSVVLVRVSILYLAVQVRHNNNSVKGASHHAVTDTFNAVLISAAGAALVRCHPTF
jgi:hypothetical protein